MPIGDLVRDRAVNTIILVGFTIIFTWAVAIPIGIFSAVKQYSLLDYIFTFISYIGIGTPNFLLALIAMFLMLDQFGLNVTGLFSDEYIRAPWSLSKLGDMLKHIWVPVIILGTDGTARLTRIVRANLLDELSKPYIDTARSKGLPEWKLILKYPVRLALNPVISTAGLELAEVFSGSLILATVMNLPTLGPLLLDSLLSKDMYLASTLLLVTTSLVMIGMLISDIVLSLIDPRINIKA
jgi:peptide/nickel transport system permease protein